MRLHIISTNDEVIEWVTHSWVNCTSSYFFMCCTWYGGFCVGPSHQRPTQSGGRPTTGGGRPSPGGGRPPPGGGRPPPGGGRPPPGGGRPPPGGGRPPPGSGKRGVMVKPLGCTPSTCTDVLLLQEQAQERPYSRGSFKRSNQPRMHAEGQRKRARKSSTSDYSKADFMKPPSGGG